MAVAFNKFNQFVEDLAKGVHDFSTDTIKVALCAAANAPVATNTVVANLTEISYTNLDSQVVAVASVAQTSGTLEVEITDEALVAGGGAVGPFQYVVLFNDTPTSPADPLIGWWNLGAETTLNDGEQLTLNFADPTFTVA